MKSALVSLIASASADLVAKMSVTSDGLAEFEVTNTGSEPAKFPTWFSPFDEMMPLYNLQFTGKSSPEYMGLVARRLPETEPILVVEAGSSLKKTFRPESQWQMQAGQEYSLQWGGREGVAETSSPAMYVASNATAPPPIPGSGNNTDHGLLGYSITNCGASGSSKYNTVVNGVNLGTAGNKRVYDCLRTSGQCGNYYNTWYGAKTDSRMNAITKKHGDIASALSGSWIAYCDGSECSPNVYAYVYPSDSRRNIYLCQVFYNNKDPVELTNTPVHEMSHFTSVAGTQDYTYGESSCKNLASSNPDRAISNADNIGYMSYYGR